MTKIQTDPENTDYAIEHGATRNFQAEKLLEEEEKRIQQEREDEELNNPMKVGVQKNENLQCSSNQSYERINKTLFVLAPGAGESHKGFQDGDGSSGEPPGAEGAEPEAGSGGLRGNARPIQRNGTEGEGEDKGRR